MNKTPSKTKQKASGDRSTFVCDIHDARPDLVDVFKSAGWDVAVGNTPSVASKTLLEKEFHVGVVVLNKNESLDELETLLSEHQRS